MQTLLKRGLEGIQLKKIRLLDHPVLKILDGTIVQDTLNSICLSHLSYWIEPSHRILSTISVSHISLDIDITNRRNDHRSRLPISTKVKMVIGLNDPEALNIYKFTPKMLEFLHFQQLLHTCTVIFIMTAPSFNRPCTGSVKNPQYFTVMAKFVLLHI